MAARKIPTATLAVNLMPMVSGMQYQNAIAQAELVPLDASTLSVYKTLAQYAFNHFKYSTALNDYQRILETIPPSSQLARCQYMVGQIKYLQKKYFHAILDFQKVWNTYPATSWAQASKSMIQFILEYDLSIGQLKKFIRRYPTSIFVASALFDQAKREMDDNLTALAENDFQAFIMQYPQNRQVTVAQLLLQTLQDQSHGVGRKIGVLVPLSGSFALFGHSVLNGIQLALDQANQNRLPQKKWVAVVGDTQGSSKVAVHLFKKMIKQDNISALVGPILSNTISAVAPLANQLKIVMMTPSAIRSGLSKIGSYIFTNSMTDDMQGAAMAQFAFQKLKLNKFAILTPNDGYGLILSHAFEKTVEALGGTITAFKTYSPYATDFQSQIFQLGGISPSEKKDHRRENEANEQALSYNLNLDIEKALIRLKIPINPQLSVAVMPMVEASSNTECPSMAQTITDEIQKDFRHLGVSGLRPRSLVQQALTILPTEASGNTLLSTEASGNTILPTEALGNTLSPTEASGNTLTVTNQEWLQVANQLQVSLMVTGKVTEVDSESLPNMESSNPMWNYKITLHFWVIKSGATEGSQLQPALTDHRTLSLYKPENMIRTPMNYQALYCPAHTSEIPLLMPQLQFYGLNPIVLGGNLWNNPKILEKTSAALNSLKGVYFTAGFLISSQQSSTQQFVKTYKKEFAALPDLLAAESYDATNLLLKAMSGSTTSEAIDQKLLQIQNYPGVTGLTTFDGNGDAQKVVPIVRYQNGIEQQVQ
jgi:ABC-type branched-subunit amino acid transport system substrate-binding protein